VKLFSDKLYRCRVIFWGARVLFFLFKFIFLVQQFLGYEKLTSYLSTYTNIHSDTQAEPGNYPYRSYILTCGRRGNQPLDKPPCNISSRGGIRKNRCPRWDSNPEPSVIQHTAIKDGTNKPSPPTGRGFLCLSRKHILSC
jgi:hypothetical protein